MLDLRKSGPVRYSPRGTSTVPPPLPAQSSMAFWKAVVSGKIREPSAPKLRTLHTRSGKALVDWAEAGQPRPAAQDRAAARASAEDRIQPFLSNCIVLSKA